MANTREIITSLITRRYPLYSGCGTFANSRFVSFLSGRSSGESWCKISGGEVLADLDDYVGRAVFFVGDLDRKIHWICKKLVKEGDTVLDIGANIGLYSVLLSSLVGDRGRVICFEPNPRLSGKLEQTLRHNKITNTSVMPMALGSEDSTLELLVPLGNRGAASLVRNRQESSCESVMVDVRTLDSAIGRDHSSIRLIKIDVEGFETQVFEGAREILSTRKPDSILFELNDRQHDEIQQEKLIKLLDNFGYDFFAIPKSMVRMKLLRLNKAIGKERTFGHDFLAAPRGEKFEEIAQLVGVD